MTSHRHWRTRVGLKTARAFGQSFSQMFWHAHRAGMLPGSRHVRVIADIPYASGHDRRALDVYLPNRPHSAKRLPFVFFVHGGGWMMCDRRMSAAVGRTLAARGLAVIAPGYRLVPDVTHGEQLHDVSLALDYTLTQGAERFGLDVRRYSLAGESAGAHLAMRLAQRFSPALPTPRTLIGVYGLYDLHHFVDEVPWTHEVMVDALRRGRAVNSLAAEHTALRPLAFGDVPVLLMHGDEDWLSHPDQSHTLAEYLRGLGVPVDLHVYPGARHGFIYNGSPRMRPIAARAYRTMFRFMLRHGVAPTRSERNTGARSKSAPRFAKGSSPASPAKRADYARVGKWVPARSK